MQVKLTEGMLKGGMRNYCCLLYFVLCVFFFFNLYSILMILLNLRSKHLKASFTRVVLCFVLISF